MSELLDANVQVPMITGQQVMHEVNGLLMSDIDALRQQHGRNELHMRSHNPALRFLAYFWGPIPWTIELAAIICFATGLKLDAEAIMVILLGLGAAGYWTEWKHDRRIKTLRSRLDRHVCTMRDGTWKLIHSHELVPGDVIQLQMGDVVPADVHLISGDVIIVDASLLAPHPVLRGFHHGDMIYSGVKIRSGWACARIHTTGRSTRLSQLVEASCQRHCPQHFYHRSLLQDHHEELSYGQSAGGEWK